jgi:N-methylhydantoinase A/oxoprolinase/acetone carboxylase beta subunit
LASTRAPRSALRIGVDTGGTFTDVAVVDRGRLRIHKVPSTPDDPARGVLDGLAAVRGERTVDVVHGTTVGLNAVLTGRLARTAFVTNEGFLDLIEIGRQDRLGLYALAPRRPVPPVLRDLVGAAGRASMASDRNASPASIAPPCAPWLAPAAMRSASCIHRPS